MQERAAAPKYGRPKGPAEGAYAALDLGTNNCRLLIARRAPDGFSVVGSFSRIVRLGEGLAASGRLDEKAMARAMAALHICAQKIGAWRIAAQRCIATQACRIAENGAEFLARVRAETGLDFAVISAGEEAALSVRGCAGLIDRGAEAALIVDVGGGSTELSWVDAKTGETRAWMSLPIGVVTLSERHGDRADDRRGYQAMLEEVRAQVASFRGADAMRAIFARGGAHALGTSGAVTSLAAAKLGLTRYERRYVDGVWMSVEDTRRIAAQLRQMGRDGRARHGCIGPDRADLVVPGAAILEAVFIEWPVARVRVADRGLREGMLLSLMEGRRAQ